MKTVRLVCVFCLVLVTMLTFSSFGLALAQDGTTEPAPVEEIILRPTYPTVESIAGGEFNFEMELIHLNGKSRVFDLRATAPPGWQVYLTPQYQKDNKISSITLAPAFSAGEKIQVFATAPFWPLPDPGDYKIKFQAISDNISSSVDIVARITARYMLSMVPTLQVYNTEAQTGKDNFFSMDIGNLGTAPVNNIKFVTTKPEGWSIDFKPDKVDIIDALNSQTVEMNIKPPKNTIAGDYEISVRATGQQIASEEIKIRVTVNTPPTWQWVGVGIIILVVAGVVVVFMRFSRR